MVKRTKSKKERTKEKIFKTATSLFLTKGYENTTVQEITEKAEVAKGTFFSHFKTKDAILTYLGEQRTKLMKDMLVDELVEVKSTEERIITLFDLLAKVNEEDKEITKLISFEILKKLYSPELETETNNQMELKLLLEEILINGQEKGEFSNDFQPSHVADIFIGIYFFVLFQWLSDESNCSLENEFRQRISIVLRGIVANGN